MAPIFGPRIDQNRIRKASKNKALFKSEKVALQEPLDSVLGRSWGTLEAIFGSQKSLRYGQAQCLVNFHVFDVDQLPRRVLDRSWPILAAKRPQNDPNLAPQDDPKSAKNRVQKMIKILIEKKTFPPIHFGRSGGMRWPPGGIIGGAKNSLFELCRYLICILWL